MCILLFNFNSYVKFHTKIVRIAEIPTEVARVTFYTLYVDVFKLW